MNYGAATIIDDIAHLELVKVGVRPAHGDLEDRVQLREYHVLAGSGTYGREDGQGAAVEVVIAPRGVVGKRRLPTG